MGRSLRIARMTSGAGEQMSAGTRSGRSRPLRSAVRLTVAMTLWRDNAAATSRAARTRVRASAARAAMSRARAASMSSRRGPLTARRSACRSASRVALSRPSRSRPPICAAGSSTGSGSTSASPRTSSGWACPSRHGAARAPAGRRGTGAPVPRDVTGAGAPPEAPGATVLELSRARRRAAAAPRRGSSRSARPGRRRRRARRRELARDAARLSDEARDVIGSPPAGSVREES
jgi:hypothetical protein